MKNILNPIERMAIERHEFGEHGGVNMSIEASSTFTVTEPDTMPAMFDGQKPRKTGVIYMGAASIQLFII